MSDPILTAVGVGLRRIALFFFLIAGVWLGLWLWVLLGKYQLDWHEIEALTRAAWPPTSNLTTSLLFWGCCAIGVETTLVVYLVAALWWRRVGDVHRRGTKFLDERRD